MLPKARSTSATLIASLTLLLVLASCTTGDDDPDIVLPLESTGLALSSSGTGTPGLPTTASANPLDSFGLGSRAMSLGSALTASGGGAYAAYYNPAGASLLKDPTFSLGYHYASLDMQIDDQSVPLEPARGTDGRKRCSRDGRGGRRGKRPL